jgi:RNA:NAD 2'-phosphotransferase (TPT1/KptA family)
MAGFRPRGGADVKISKTLSYILRHGAGEKGLTIR